jgi:hypothetical protein
MIRPLILRLIRIIQITVRKNPNPILGINPLNL